MDGNSALREKRKREKGTAGEDVAPKEMCLPVMALGKASMTDQLTQLPSAVQEMQGESYSKATPTWDPRPSLHQAAVIPNMHT